MRLALVILACSALVAPGCKPRNKAVKLDPETQRELEEFEKQLEAATQALMANQPVNSLDVTTDESNVSPAMELETGSGPDLGTASVREFVDSNNVSSAVATESVARKDKPDTLGSLHIVPASAATVPDFRLENKELISGLIDNAFDGKAVGESRQTGIESGFDPVTEAASENANERHRPGPPILDLKRDESLNLEGRPSGEFEPIRVSGAIENLTGSNDHPKREAKPQEVCRRFIEALVRKNPDQASRLLTKVAWIETQRAELVLEAPGNSESVFEIGHVRYPADSDSTAIVECHLFENPGTEPVSLNWLMRRQYNGWRISGMTIVMPGDRIVEHLDFESPTDLVRIENSVGRERRTEIANQPSSAEILR